MLSTIRKQKTSGFTIIEVLIVLAIAGLIMLIVFLAVPALQRNARNTQRRNDIGSVLSGITEFTNDNQGTLPTGIAIAGNGTSTYSAAGATSVDGAKLGFYSNGNVTVTNVVGNTTPAVAPTDKAVVITGATCSGNTAVAGTARSVVVTYWIEPNNVEQCQGS